MIASSLHEESMVQIGALAVPSTSSGTYESYSSLRETGVKRAGCNFEDQTSKKQCRKILENISNLNKLPVSFPITKINISYTPFAFFITHFRKAILHHATILRSGRMCVKL